MNNSIYILHLSDLHIDPQEEGESKPVFDSLCKKIKNFREENDVKFSLLIVSGDLINRGAMDYKPVEKRLDEILSATNLSHEQVFIVPGNHDIIRDNCTSYHYKITVKALKSNPREIMELDQTAKEVFFPGFESYTEFTKKFPLTRMKSFDLPGFNLADINISGIPVRLCGLNTALVAGPEDQDKNDDLLKDRVAGCNLLWKMLGFGGYANERLHLVVSHYPLKWVHPEERNEVAERLQQAGAIFFHGHVHKPETDIQGVVIDNRLLVVGAGSMYGQKWEGRNHCQILELNPDRSNPLLHEWYWFSNYGWRGVEPIKIDHWIKWDCLKKSGTSDKTPHPGTSDTLPSRRAIVKSSNIVGLVDIGNNRKQDKRTAYIQEVLQSAVNNSEVIVVGRSLVDWASLSNEIERAINNKNLHLKLALLDENTLPNKSRRPDESNNKSWIEKPIPSDWAMADVLNSMERFRRIKVTSETGTLQVFGLPFYVSRSFIAYTKEHDNQRYCLEEMGMALDKENRPFIEFKVASDKSYASSLEGMYRKFMVDDRLLLFNDGQNIIEKNTTNRAKIIVPKIEEHGLVDLAILRDNIDWSFETTGSIPKLIENTPENGEIFIVGRSLVAWTNHYMELARAVIEKAVTCTFTIADPTLPELKSLVKGDYAEVDLPACWKNFHEKLYPYLKDHKQEVRGKFELYGIPAYVPSTFASYVGQDGVKFCNLEIGIGVTPSERVILYFSHVSKNDMYTLLNNIYRGIINGREPLLKICENK